MLWGVLGSSATMCEGGFESTRSEDSLLAAGVRSSCLFHEEAVRDINVAFPTALSDLSALFPQPICRSHGRVGKRSTALVYMC